MQTVLARIQDCSRQHRHSLIGIDGCTGAMIPTGEIWVTKLKSIGV